MKHSRTFGLIGIGLMASGAFSFYEAGESSLYHKETNRYAASHGVGKTCLNAQRTDNGDSTLHTREMVSMDCMNSSVDGTAAVVERITHEVSTPALVLLGLGSTALGFTVGLMSAEPGMYEVSIRRPEQLTL